MSEAFDLRLAGGTAVLPGEGVRAADVLVREGRIAALVDPGVPAEARETLDCGGLHVLPGAVDPHVHLSQDISTPKTREDVEPETQAAAAGGVTTMLVYLLSPGSYDDLLEPSKAAMDAHAAIDYGFHYCITKREQLDRLPAYVSDHGVSSFKYFMNFRGDEGAYLKLPGTDDGFLLDLLESAAAEGAMVDPHAENIELVWRLRDRGLPADADAEPLAVWDRLRPGYVEAEALGRVAYLAQVAGASMYAVHTTNADSLRLLEQARERYGRVFVETCPHYLTLGTDSDIGTYGKVNPPLRTPADREALWEAIRSGLVDTIGSDHVPRQRRFKEQPLMKASAGFPGLQTLLPLMLSEGHLQRGIPLERIVDLVSTRAAELFGLGERKGAIRPGADADLVVVDLAAPSRIEAAAQLSGAEYTPWDGHRVGVTIRHTLVRGEFALRDGSIVPGARGRFLERPSSGAGGARGGAMSDKPWAGVIGPEDERVYELAGFGGPSGFGERPALLVIDVQYRTLGDSPKPFEEAVKDYPTAGGEVAWAALPQIERLVTTFRELDLPILYPHVAPKLEFDHGRLGAKVPSILTVAERGYAIPDSIAPRPQDVLLPKRHPSAFFGTPLASYLIERGADTLVVTGTSTSGCIRASVVDGFAYNFRVVVPHDAVWDRTPTVHKVNLFDMAQKYADVTTTDELDAELRRRHG